MVYTALYHVQVEFFEAEFKRRMELRFYTQPTDPLWNDQWFIVSLCSQHICKHYDTFRPFSSSLLLLSSSSSSTSCSG